MCPARAAGAAGSWLGMAIVATQKLYLAAIAFIFFFGAIEQQLFIFRDLYYMHESLGSDQWFFLSLFVVCFLALVHQFAAK